MEKYRLLVVVVLYKSSFNESKTLSSVKKQNWKPDDFKLIIWDNSPVPQLLEAINDEKKYLDFEYIAKPENEWLSKVYNQVVEKFSFDYIMLLDQDSIIPPDYFTELHNSIKENPAINLFLPIVKNNNKIVSPASFQFFKGKHWKTETTGLTKSKNIIAVTSGMVISGNYFNKHSYKFDERLNLYAIDTKFMLDYARNEELLFILSLVFQHNSALWSNPSKDDLLPRFRNLRKAWSIMLSDRPIAYLLTNVYSLYVSLKLSLKYRDIRFLKK